MSFRNINKVFLFLIIFLSYSCKTIEKISKEKDNNIQTINNNYDFEFNEKIFLKKNNVSNDSFADYYSDYFNNEVNFENNIQKKLTINNFKKPYNGIKPLKMYIIDDYLYSIDIQSNLNIYNLENGKLINSIKLFDKKNKNIPIPTSMSIYDNDFIIGFKTGRIIKISKEGDLIWEYQNDQILSTPIKIYKQKLIVLYGNTIKFLSLENGNVLLSETYQGSDVINSKGGSVKIFANILYFILPNSTLGEIDTLFNEKSYSNFSKNNYQDSINNAYDEIHVHDNFVSYFDDRLNLYCYDIYSDKFILNKKRISGVNSFKFFNNALVVKNNNTIKAYNLKNGKIFWSFDIKKLLKKDLNIISVLSINDKVNILFDNGEALIIDDNKIINLISLKIKDINLLYSQNNSIFFSLKNGKTSIF